MDVHPDHSGDHSWRLCGEVMQSVKAKVTDFRLAPELKQDDFAIQRSEE